MNKVGTLRFEVKLDVNNTENYEISLMDLMKKNEKNVNQSNKEEVEEMNNYIAQLEKKFGPVAVVKGKKIRVNDFLIQGAGYDADDPFIDDSGTEEAVVVAPDIMTQYGGFFINSDTLKLNESSFVIERVEGEDDLTLLSKQHFPHKTNKLSKSQQLLSQAKKRLSTTKKLSVTSSNHTLDEIINDVVSVKVRKEANSKTEPDHVKINKKIEAPETVIVIKTPEKDQPNVSNTNNNHTTPKPVYLPPDIPEILKNKINLLIEISKSCKNDGVKLTNQSNIILMEIDMILLSKNTSKSLRTQILRYIGSTIDVKYDSIVRKINKFKETRRKQIQSTMLESLQESIKEAMPNSLAKYEADMKSYVARLEAQKLQNAVETQIINIDLTTNQEIETKAKPINKINPPKRNFKWTTSCKGFLLKLVTEELESLKIGKMRTAPEEHLTKFFTTSVVNFWPPKWMTNLQLMKISGPLITEFKNCTSNGKESKCELAIVKQKPTQKVKLPHTGPAAKLKEPPTNPVKHVDSKIKSELIIATGGIPKEVAVNPVKVLISPSKQIDKAHLENHSTTADPCKSRLIEMHKEKHHLISNQIPSNKTRKSSPPSVQMLPKAHQNLKPPMPFVSVVDKNVAHKESLKRSSMEIVDGPVHKSMLLSHVDKSNANIQLMQHMTNEKIQASCTAANVADQQIRASHRQSNPSTNHYVHSNPYPHLVNNVSPESLHKITNRQSQPPTIQSTIQSINTLLNSPIETRQNIPQHMSMVNKTSLTQHNMQQATNIQRHFMGLQPEYDSPNKAIFHHNANAPTLDLIESPISMNAHQISPDIYYNFSNAHFNNQRRFQN